MAGGWPAAIMAAPTPTELSTARARAEYRAIDLKLNRAYQALLGHLKPTSRKALIETQRAWIRFRDLECGFQLIATGPNTLADYARYQCMTDLTYDREWQVNKQLQCPGVEGVRCPHSRWRR